MVRETLQEGLNFDFNLSCHVCHKVRPSEKISVHHVDISDRFHLPVGGAKMNVRYCNDNPKCKAQAPFIELLVKKDG